MATHVTYVHTLGDDGELLLGEVLHQRDTAQGRHDKRLLVVRTLGDHASESGTVDHPHVAINGCHNCCRALGIVSAANETWSGLNTAVHHHHNS